MKAIIAGLIFHGSLIASCATAVSQELRGALRDLRDLQGTWKATLADDREIIFEIPRIMELNRCIYELHGDTWLLKGGIKNLPKTFLSGEGKPHTTWIFKRQREKPQPAAAQ